MWGIVEGFGIGFQLVLEVVSVISLACEMWKQQSDFPSPMPVVETREW